MHICVTVWLAALSVWARVLVHLSCFYRSFPLSHSRDVISENKVLLEWTSLRSPDVEINPVYLLVQFVRDYSIYRSTGYFLKYFFFTFRSTYRVHIWKKKNICMLFIYILLSVTWSGFKPRAATSCLRACEESLSAEDMAFVNSCTWWSRKKSASYIFRKYLKISNLHFPMSINTSWCKFKWGDH